MKLTLRKANALQNSINEAIRNTEIAVVVALNEFQDATTVLATANETLVSNDARRDALTKALYTIRGQVGNANSTAGINDRLAQAAYLDKRIGQLQNLITTHVREDDVVITGKLDKIRNRPDDARSYYHEGVVSTGVLTAAQVEQYKADQRKLKKDKQKLNDEILELNVRTEIELSDDVVAILDTAGLL
ncbi:MAG TPA: hypothetical protein VFM18_16880 [Methanosarcina sp.]|nr:hypothetical protein [Methanosarcina sp.]